MEVTSGRGASIAQPIALSTEVKPPEAPQGHRSIEPYLPRALGIGVAHRFGSHEALLTQRCVAPLEHESEGEAFGAPVMPERAVEALGTSVAGTLPAVLEVLLR